MCGRSSGSRLRRYIAAAAKNVRFEEREGRLIVTAFRSLILPFGFRRYRCRSIAIVFREVMKDIRDREGGVSGVLVSCCFSFSRRRVCIFSYSREFWGADNYLKHRENYFT